jgi:hypothetical protein
MPGVHLSPREIQTEALLDFKVRGLKTLLLPVQNRLVAQKLRIRMRIDIGSKNHLFGKIHGHHFMMCEVYIPKASSCVYPLEP